MRFRMLAFITFILAVVWFFNKNWEHYINEDEENDNDLK